MQNYSIKDLKRDLRAGKYTFPGCYPTYFITSDCQALSHEAVRDNFKQIISAMRDPRDNSSWRIVGADVNWEDPCLVCAETGERIESAYAEDEANKILD